MLVPQRVALCTQHLKTLSRLPLPFLTPFLGFEQGHKVWRTRSERARSQRRIEADSNYAAWATHRQTPNRLNSKKKTGRPSSDIGPGPRFTLSSPLPILMPLQHHTDNYADSASAMSIGN